MRVNESRYINKYPSEPKVTSTVEKTLHTEPQSADKLMVPTHTPPAEMKQWQQPSHLKHTMSGCIPNDANTPTKSQAQSRPKGISQVQLIQAMAGYLAQCYTLIQDINRGYFLQNRLDLTVQPVNVDMLTVPMKTFAIDMLNKEPNDRMIRSAIDLFLGQQYPTMLTIPVHCGRKFNLLGDRLYYCSAPDHMRELSYNPASGPYQAQIITAPPPLMINGLASSSYAYHPHVRCSVLENLFRGYSVPEGEYLVLITWMVSTLVPGSSAYLLELVDEEDERVNKIQRDLKQLIDPCRQNSIPEVPTQRKHFDSLAMGHFLLNFSPVDKLTVPAQKNLLDLLNGYTVDMSRKPTRDSYSVFVQRPVLLSADESLITHEPLLNRAITLHLFREDIPANVDMGIPFDAYFSAWLNLAAYVNYWMGQRYDEKATPLETFREMGRLVCAALGKDEQLFIQAMDRQASIRLELSLSESAVAQALIAYLDQNGPSERSMSMSDWLDALEPFRPKHVRSTNWPVTPRALGAALKKAKSVLAASDIECFGEKQGSYRVWSIRRKTPPEPSAANQSQAPNLDA